MSTYTKPGSEIYIEDKDTCQFSPETHQNIYGLMVADSTARLGFKIAFCSACQKAPVDFSNDDLDLTISMDLHAIEHAWCEKYKPKTQKQYDKVYKKFLDSLTVEMQDFEIERKKRIDAGIAQIASFQERGN